MAENGSWIQKLFTSRDRNTLKFDDEFGNLGTTFVGEVGRLWYNPDTNCLYVSDGKTPGGIPLNTCGNVLGVANIAIYDEGNLIANRTASFDFVGAGVTATAVGNAITISIPGAATSGVTVQDEGNLLTNNLQTLDFVGNGVIATAVGNTVTVTIPTPQTYPLTVADEGSNLTQTANSINFVGNGVTATAVGNAITVTIVDTDTSSALTVQDEGNLLTTAANVMNFVGEGVTANAVGNVVTVDVGPGIAYLYSGAFIYDNSTTLTADINSNSTDPIPVVSTSGFGTSGYIAIGTEVIAYTGITATTFTGITRGVAGSNGSTHDTGDGVGQAQVTPANVVKQVLLDVTDISNNVTLDPATGNVTVGGTGTYNLQYSVQLECFGNAPDDAAVWFVINGNVVPKSNSYGTVQQIHAGVPGRLILTVNIFAELNAGDVVALQWTTLGGTVTISSVPPVNGIIPLSPGVIFTVNRIY